MATIMVIALLVISSLSSQLVEMSSASWQSADSWLWVHDTSMDDTNMNSYLLGADTFTDRTMCTLACLIQYPTCLSFFMSNNTHQPNHVDCRFHEGLFTTWERDNFGVTVPNTVYYRVQPACPMTIDHFFSREARMCVKVELTGVTQPLAAAGCANQGAQLVILDSQEKINFIIFVLMNTSVYTNKLYYLNAAHNGSHYVWANGQVVSLDLIPSHKPPIPSDTCVVGILNANYVLRLFPFGCDDALSCICEYPI